MLKSRFLSSVRFFMAAAGDPPSGGDAGDDAAGGAPAAGADDDAGAGGDDAAGGTPAAGADDAGAGGDDAAAAGAKPPGISAEDWRDKEIRRKHGQLQNSKRREAELEAELETTRALLARQSGGAAAAPAASDDGAAAAPAARAPLAADNSEAVRAAAQELRSQERFEEAATAADISGSKRFGDGWKTATDRLATLGGFDKATMTQILATDDPAQVLHELGSKPEEYQRLMELEPARRQTELVKLGLKKTPAPGARRPDTSVAPPVDGVHSRPRGDATALRDDLSDDDWYARRAAQKKAKWEAKQRGAA